MWFVLRKLGNIDEENACKKCRKVIPEQLASEMLVPEYEFLKKYQGNWKMECATLYPGYIFLVTDEPEEILDRLKPLSQTVEPVYTGKEFLPIYAEEQELLEALLNRNRIVKFSRGDIIGGKCIVNKGPLKGYEDRIRYIDRHHRKCRIAIDLHGEEKLVEVGLEIVRKLFCAAFIITAISILILCLGLIGTEAVSASERIVTEQGKIWDFDQTEKDWIDRYFAGKRKERTVTCDGKQYRYKDGLKNYLILGIDHDDVVKEAEDGWDGGQSDAMFLLSVDREEKRLSVVAINRNTIVPLDVYDEDGEPLGRMPLQICLQHGYGDGLELSCQRSVNAVKRLFDYIPISGYISLNNGGIPALNDAVGGVTLTPVEGVTSGDINISEGKRITLDGRQAKSYFVFRDTSQFGSANRRLFRQGQYIVSFLRQLKKDPPKAEAVCNAIEDYLVTDVDLVSLIRQTQDMDLSEEDLYFIPGATIQNGDYEEFYPDQKGFLEIICKIFYEEIE